MLIKSSSDRDPDRALDSVKIAFALIKGSSDRDPGHALDSVKNAFSPKKNMIPFSHSSIKVPSRDENSVGARGHGDKVTITVTARALGRMSEFTGPES